MTPVSIPSPPLDWEILFQLGGFKVHAYALAILVGIFVALWMTRRRWVARGGEVGAMEEIAVWAIPFGIVGGRIYHVVSTPGPYFGHDGHPLNALKIWEGGLGIWGAIAFGVLGAYFGARRAHVPLSAFLDAVAPGVLIAQAIGRLGNYFNQELFGAPTTMPWGLQIDAAGRYFPNQYEAGTLFQPTFLYELLWNLAGAALLIYLDRRLKLRFGRMFWLYVMVYTSGRLWIEMLRIDTAVEVGGVRINVWVAIGTLLLGTGMFIGLGLRHRGQTDDVPALSLAPAPVAAKPDVAVKVRAKATVEASKATAKPDTAVKATAEASKATAKPDTAVEATVDTSKAGAKPDTAVTATAGKSKATVAKVERKKPETPE
jgi:prolipoprotein diacylglyceryl transferase